MIIDNVCINYISCFFEDTDVSNKKQKCREMCTVVLVVMIAILKDRVGQLKIVDLHND